MRIMSGLGGTLMSLVTLSLFVFTLASCTIVPDEDKGTKKKGEIDIYFVSDDFNPDAFVQKIWEAKVVPYFNEKSQPVTDVLSVWAIDQEAAGKQFGYREKAEGSPWNFLVRGEGSIVDVNTESRASTVGVDLEPGDGKADLVIQIGPVIKDSGIRDSLEFISFTDFTNQLEFARLSNAFNKQVHTEVLSKLDRENLLGKDVSFIGVFTQLQGTDLVRVTPVVIKVN